MLAAKEGHGHTTMAQTLRRRPRRPIVRSSRVESRPLGLPAISTAPLTRPEAAETMENYAALLREAGRDTEAAEMEARAKTIRNNHTGEN